MSRLRLLVRLADEPPRLDGASQVAAGAGAGAERAHGGDPDDFDAKIAGWWCWGQSSWIGHGWCDGARQETCVPLWEGWRRRQGVSCSIQPASVEDKRPKVPDGGDVPDRIPSCRPQGGGEGVQQQRDQIPHVNHMPGGKGVSAQRVAVGEPRDQHAARREPGCRVKRRPTVTVATSPICRDDGVLDGSRLRPWFAAISQRLARVIILNRSWESALTDSVLQQTPSSPKPEVGVFLDPPYRTTAQGRRQAVNRLYQGDTAGASDDVATASYKWAVEHGEHLVPRRLLHARGRLSDPAGLDGETMGFSGHRDEAKKESSVDCIIFSPACVPAAVDPQQEFGW